MFAAGRESSRGHNALHLNDAIKPTAFPDDGGRMHVAAVVLPRGGVSAVVFFVLLRSMLASSSVIHAQMDADEPLFRLQSADQDFWSGLSVEQIGVLEKLNRRDRRHLNALDSVVVPCEWPIDELLVSPLPRRFPEAAGISKLILVDKEWQVFGAYESGSLVRWGPISSGRRTMRTPQGVYHLNWRSKGRHSTVNALWYMKWYFNFENRRGLSFHQYALPGRPASHACIRLLERDARWLYSWGEAWKIDATGRRVLRSGTPMLIVERFDFEARPPWRSPDALRRGIALPELPSQLRAAHGYTDQVAGDTASRLGASLTPLRHLCFGDGNFAPLKP
jgi:hypothetical protein